MAQLVEHCSANAEAMGSNPVEAPKTFFGLNCDYLNRKLNCDDHTFISYSQLSTCKTPRLRIDLRPNWCEANALTTVPPMLSLVQVIQIWRDNTIISLETTCYVFSQNTGSEVDALDLALAHAHAHAHAGGKVMAWQNNLRKKKDHD